MDIFQTILLALVQGATEFLPISSSAHLILPAQLLGWQDQGLAFDVAVHFGSLLAVVYFFRHDLQRMALAWMQSCGSRNIDSSPDARLAWMVILATLPAVLVGLSMADLISAHLRSTTVIAVSTIFFGLLLAVAEYSCRRNSRVVEITWTIALCIGVAQVFALIPGTSRSGVTITAAVLLGLTRTNAARFSFLLSVPLITAASFHQLWMLLTQDVDFDWLTLLLGLVVSGISAYLCIGLFLRLLERIGFMPFVWYRLLLGGVLIVLIPA